MYPNNFLGIISFNCRNPIDVDLLLEYFERKKDTPKTHNITLINQWINDAEIIENEVHILLDNMNQ